MDHRILQQFPPSVDILNVKKWHNINYLWYITFIFDKCLNNHGWAAVKWERNAKESAHFFAKNFHYEDIVKRGPGNLNFPLKWRHNEFDGASNHQPHDCLLNRVFVCRSKKTSKLRVTGLCEGNLPVTGEFPAQRASNAEKDSISWRHHASSPCGRCNIIQPSQSTRVRCVTHPAGAMQTSIKTSRPTKRM